MGLSSFAAIPEVVAKFKPLRPKLPRKIDAPVKAEPRTNHHPLVGSAFDYFLRFELQRRAPHAIARRWVAEYAPEIAWRKTETGYVGLDLLWKGDLQNLLSADYLPPQEVAQWCHRILADAKQAVATFIKSEAPSREMLASLAEHAIRLAKLDPVCRGAGRLDPTFREADPEDVQDLLNLLSIVPFDALIHKSPLILNPTFQESASVGGVDADLVAGDLLVDLKTTKTGEMKAEHLDQLLGYFLLARRQRLVDPSFPGIERLGFYFSRHGHLWTQDASVWTRHPEFSELESWFLEHAKEILAGGLALTETA
jgi:hypothetical protein